MAGAFSDRLGLGGLSVGQLVGDRAHDRGVADRTVVERCPVDDRDRIEQPARLDLGDDRVELGADVFIVDVAVGDDSVVTKAACQLGGDDGGDLLRRP